MSVKSLSNAHITLGMHNDYDGENDYDVDQEVPMVGMIKDLGL